MMYDCSTPLDMIKQHYRYIVVIDFEATCDEGRDVRDYPHEIIEFPLVLIDLDRQKRVKEIFRTVTLFKTSSRNC